MATIPRASEVADSAVIPTGLPQLDRILGIGGIPFKRITEISGQWSVGKTTLALTVVASAQREGIECIWIDAEWAWDGTYATSLGVNTKKLGLLQTRVAEDSLDTLLQYVEKGRDTLIVASPGKSSQVGRTIGSQSALIARFCRKIVPLLSMNNNALIVLNHEYTPIESMRPGQRPQVKTSGGAKLEYHKSIWLRLKKLGTQIKEGEKFVGFDVEAEVRKNKLAPTQKQSCALEMIYGKGFSAQTDLLADALAKGVITEKDSSFFMDGEKLCYGKPKVKKLLLEPVFAEKVRHALGAI